MTYLGPDPHPQPSLSPKAPTSLKYVTYIAELFFNIIVNPDPAEAPFFIFCQDPNVMT